MRRLALLAALAPLAACVPVIPPPSSYAPLPAVAATGGGSGGLAATCCFLPAISGDYAIDLSTPGARGPAMVLDLRGQLGPTHGVGGGGVWLRSNLQQAEGPFWGARLGFFGGSGDLLGVLPFGMPYAGANLSGQFAHRWSSGRRLALSAGLEMAAPLLLAIDDADLIITDDAGDEVIAAPLPSGYLPLGATFATPVGRGNAALELGGGMDVLMYGVPLPKLSLGLRF